MAAVTQVGVDIGSHSIRAVEATSGKDDRPLISNFGQAMLPAGAVVGGVVKDDTAVTNALRTLWTTQRFASKSVILAASHQQVIVRRIELPNLSRKEMRQTLPFQVQDKLPLPVDQAVLDFYPLKDANGDPGKKQTVTGLVIAAPKDAVLATVRAVERAGLYVAQVDLACFAALRSSAHLAEDTEAVLDIGATATNLVIHTDGVPQIVRTISRGGTEVTDLIAKRLRIPGAEAEALKCHVGLLRSDNHETADAVAEAIRPLINEIRSSLNYYRAGDPGNRVKRLALVGGSALLPGLSGRLTEQLGLPTFLADPLQRVADSRGDSSHDVLGRLRSSAAVAIGLTLGAA